MITIDTLREDDIEQVGALARSIDLFNAKEVETIEWIARTYLKYDDHYGYNFVLGKIDGEIQGFAVYVHSSITQSTFELYWLGVAPHTQGQGVGSALLLFAEEDALRRGGRRMLIETSSRPDYALTLQFYEKHQYVRLAQIRDYYADGDDKIIFGKYY